MKKNPVVLRTNNAKKILLKLKEFEEIVKNNNDKKENDNKVKRTNEVEGY